MASVPFDNTDSERSSLWQDLPLYKRPQNKQHSGETARKQRQDRCIALTGEGGYNNACKALISPPPLSQTEEFASKLRDKHPCSTRPVDLSTFNNVSSTSVPLADVVIVEKCIRSFHRLSGGGPSGLRPIHIKNCLSTEHRDEVVERCTALVNLLAKGDAPASLAPFLAGGNLTALPKKDNGIRPVAVGEVWRRLTAKCLCNEFKEQTSAFFFPQQIGVGQPLGTEVGLEKCGEDSQQSAYVMNTKNRPAPSFFHNRLGLDSHWGQRLALRQLGNGAAATAIIHHQSS